MGAVIQYACVTQSHLGPASPAWYGVRVRARFEQTASAAFRGRGYEEYVPVVRSRRRWSDRIKELQTPLFPGYVFCRFDPGWKVPILECPGVLNIIGFANHAAPIPDEEIQAVRAMVRSGLPVQPYPFLKAGQKVHVERGPLAGVEGLIVEVKKEFRLVVSITLLQRSISAEIDREWVRPIS